MSPTTKPSTRPLSEVKKELVIPSGIVSTAWPAVAYWLKRLGLGFDGWQQGAAKLILGKRADGLYACTVGGAFLSVPRQVGKTYMVGALVFALCLLHPGMTVIWTAHRLKTAGETFRSMQGMARRKSVAAGSDPRCIDGATVCSCCARWVSRRGERARSHRPRRASGGARSQGTTGQRIAASGRRLGCRVSCLPTRHRYRSGFPQRAPGLLPAGACVRWPAGGCSMRPP